MPRKANDYSNTIIYKICCKDISVVDTYIGHTTDFIWRLYGHKSACTNESHKNYNMRMYQFIRNNGTWNNWEMLELETVCCLDKKEAILIERKYYDLLKPTLNTRVPSRTKQQADIDNRDNRKEYMKQYYKKNKELIDERTKIYREANPLALTNWRNNNLEHRRTKEREYYQTYKAKQKLKTVENNISL